MRNLYVEESNDNNNSFEYIESGKPSMENIDPEKHEKDKVVAFSRHHCIGHNLDETIVAETLMHNGDPEALELGVNLNAESPTMTWTSYVIVDNNDDEETLKTESPSIEKIEW